MADVDEVTSSIQEEIETQNRHFQEQFAARDAPAMAAFYTENGIVIPPQSEALALIGQEAILGWFAGAFDMGLGWIELETTSVSAVTDSIAIEVGKFRIGPSPGEVGDTGGYTVHWLLTADGWRIHRDVIVSALLPVVSRDLANGGLSG